MINQKMIKELIQANVYEGRHGHKMIKIPHYGLDFSAEFVFLGFSQSGRIRLGEVISSSPKGIKWMNRLGRFDGEYLTVMGDQYLKSIHELEKDAIILEGGETS